MLLVFSSSRVQLHWVAFSPVLSLCHQRGALDWYPKFYAATKPVFAELYSEVANGNEARRTLDCNRCVPVPLHPFCHLCGVASCATLLRHATVIYE
jgi:hypothetical protein